MAWQKKQRDPHCTYVTLSLTVSQKQQLTILAERYHTTPAILARRCLAIALRRLAQLQQERTAQEAAAAAPTAPE